MNNCQSTSSELSMVNDAMRLNTLFKRFAAYSVVLPLLTVDLELPSSLTLSGGSCVGILFFPLLFSLFVNYIFGGQQAHWQSALPLKISGSTYSFVNPDYLPTVHTASERCSLHLRLPLVGICIFWAVFLPVVARSAGLPWWNLQ